MDLYLRKVVHPQAHDNYRVLLKDDGLEFEIGSIGRALGLGHDTVIPMREAEAQGRGKDRNDCMRRLRTAWDKFSADPARLTEFLQAKRKRLGCSGHARRHSRRNQNGSHHQGSEANHSKADEKAFYPVHDDPPSGIAHDV
jgi:hypothetical protein